MRMGHDRDQADPTRRWGVVCAIARPWKPVEDTTRTHLVTHVPRRYDQRTQVPRDTAGTGRVCPTFYIHNAPTISGPFSRKSAMSRERDFIA